LSGQAGASEWLEQLAEEDPSAREAVEAMASAAPRIEVPAHLNWVWRAWNRLSLDRPFAGGGLGPAVPLRIPWRDVVLWCDTHGYSTEDLWFLEKCFHKLDGIYLEWWKEKMKVKK